MQTPRPEYPPEYAKDQIYSDTYKDIYFCEEDGLDEGDHVFLKGNKLPDRWQDRSEFVITETGFGTGLNFLATWLKWEKTSTPDQHLTYISFEKFPLTPDQIREALARWKNEIGDKLEIMLENYPVRICGWHPIRISDQISLLLIFDDVNRALPELNTYVDAWFLDGFAPAKNPEMWSETVFKAMAANSYEGTTFASFTAAGLVKRGLREQNFFVAKTRGYGRKRDMIFGHFESQRQKPEKKTVKSVAIIGGGLAGANVAARLKQEGFAVEIYEEKEVAAGASGNPRGLFNPRFTSQQGYISDFYASAYACALRQFKRLKDIDYQACGSIHLLTDIEKEKRLTAMVEKCGWHQDHIKVIDAKEASEIAGVEINFDAVFLPDSGFVSPEKICRASAKNSIIVCESVQQVTYNQGQWNLNNRLYDAVVIACGAGVLNFSQTAQLPLSKVRGQLAIASSTKATEKIKTNICYGGYCSPADKGDHVIGSTFQPWLTDIDIREEDSADIVQKFESHVPALVNEMKATGARVSFRVASKDRFPVIGKMPDYDNLYISAAHGSHGLISTALAAEIITSDMIGRPSPMPSSVLKELSPQRFALREAKK